MATDAPRRICGPIDWPPGFVEKAEAWAETPEGEAFFKRANIELEKTLADPAIQLATLEAFLPEYESDLQTMLKLRPGATYENDPDVRWQINEIHFRKARIVQLRRQLMRAVR